MVKDGISELDKIQKTNTQEIKQIMDIKQLSKYLGIGKSKIYQLIRQKKIPASKIGKQYRFSKDIIDNWLKENIITKYTQIELFNKKEVK